MGHLIAALHTNVSNIQISNTQAPGWIGLRNSNVTANAGSANRVRRPSTNALEQRRKSAAGQANRGRTEALVSRKDVVSVSPLFHSFSLLPRELQDEILYHAIGYTGNVNIIRAVQVKDDPSMSRPSVTISKLFRISKMINEHMVAHIFRSTNFHFGITGFTNFMWQIGPVNRSYLQNLTFRFGKVSLLHCVRWLAPDPIWELFEPPVTTSPLTMAYFWRCQLQDLMKELTLVTLTVDIGDVPLADVPMLVRTLRSAIGSAKHIRIVDNSCSVDETRGCAVAQALHRRFPDFHEPTWRELANKYYADYKHQRWHMKHKLTQHGVDASPVLNEWMDQNSAFFDA
ncbi:uncharacterized protein M421DRAFT_436 [Didymella exigua CBS 183.55]|uniref:F-box domain-containing protein n=1 Tax=Didymella exigua CBS 183.55 TaxID=1150837 RepID=A0A6A5S3V1_9PLEO|nr:uncharacterized protein M421DRAFT_436 [Didymella exigua CBS 183.55]KAF1934300.1 hypothetical protein M421DRAFT_436 [Didymella exigua CBS 183.55]